MVVGNHNVLDFYTFQLPAFRFPFLKIAYIYRKFQKNMNILLVEDDQRISNFLIKGLSEAGYNTTLADSGEKAREIISTYDFDIILMDIMLPGLNGMQLTQVIRFKEIILLFWF